MLPLKEEIKKTPFLLALVPFVVGILLQNLFCISQIFLIILFAGSLFACTALALFSFTRGISSITYLFILLAFLLAGMLSTSTLQQNNSIEPDLYKSDAIVGTIVDFPAKSTSYQSVDFNIEAYKYAGTWHKCKTLCKLSLKGEMRGEILPGDRYLINARCQKPTLPILPDQFDYSKYLYYKSIQTTCFAKEADLMKLESTKTSIVSSVNNLRVKVLQLTGKSELPDREKAVLASLVFGFRGDIDPELKSAYSHAGVMHILSVSGMHVGIVYMFLMFLFSFLSRNPATRIVRSIIVIVGLWFYALLTGFSPPCARSALMFTFFALADLNNRSTQNMNTLAGSALVLLLINPYNLFDTGFQLSYSAMIGIFLIYVPLNKRFQYKNWISKYILQLLLVSIAAQITTLPLSLYYFHQFPSYFLLSNLVVVPASGIIIYVGLAYLLLSPFAILAHWVSYLLKYSLLGLNAFVEIIDKLPASTLGSLYITEIQVIAIVLIVVFGAIIIVRNELQYLSLLMVSILSLVILSCFQYIENQSASSVNEYRFKGESAYVINSANEAVVIADSSFYAYFKKNSNKRNTVFIDCNKSIREPRKLKNIEVYVGNHHQIFIKTVDFTIGLKRTGKKNAPYSIVWLKKVNSTALINVENTSGMLESRLAQMR